MTIIILAKNSNFIFVLKLVFEGIRGSGIQGDIAIDDVAVTTGSCRNPGK